MRRMLPLLTLALACWASPAQGHGLLIPTEKTLPPLAMASHEVRITIDEQVAVTRVEQVFRNHTDRQLEATYVFPVPKGASVRKFSMWVDGKEVPGELVEADKARKIYTDIVRQTQDPGLLEYMGNNLMRLRVFPVPAKGDQKVALSFTSMVTKDGSLHEYVYPLKSDGTWATTLEKFSIEATIKSKHAINNVYSPTHAISKKPASDHEVTVTFRRDQGNLDKDFHLYYGLGSKDVGLNALLHRPSAGENGYFLMLVSPRVEIPKEYIQPRDLVVVLDTSGSMRGAKMDQARKALKYCLENLGEKDRFALISFATTVNKFSDRLVEASPKQVADAKQWVDSLEATGGTAIHDALAAALETRPSDSESAGRSFMVVFFTDGQPTIGESRPERIVKWVEAKNDARTRIFTFGVGDDVNAAMLDQIAEKTRALASYVRPSEDIAAKVASLHAKISNPVLSNLKLETTNDVRLLEMYPPQLPDLFHGGQLVVLGRYHGKGQAAVKLSGEINGKRHEFVYEMEFAENTDRERDFVEHLWARRKVGYLLDQIRANGESRELVEEVTLLAKKYGIATPYTSYLMVPDDVVPMVRRPVPPGTPAPAVPLALMPEADGRKPLKVNEFLQREQKKAGNVGNSRNIWVEEQLNRPSAGSAPPMDQDALERLRQAQEQKEAFDKSRHALSRGDAKGYQAGKDGVNLAIQANHLKCQAQTQRAASQYVRGRNCIDVGGVWIDEGFTDKTPTLTIKAQSDAYFRMLERRPELKDVFRIGNHLVWIAPNGTALVVDANDGKETIDDAEIDRLFASK